MMTVSAVGAAPALGQVIRGRVTEPSRVRGRVTEPHLSRPKAPDFHSGYSRSSVGTEQETARVLLNSFESL